MKRTAQYPFLQTSAFKKAVLLALLSAGVLTSQVQLSATPVFAQQEEFTLESQQEAGYLRLTAIPPRLGEDYAIKALPGQTVQTSVRIKNTSLQPQTIQTLVEDFIIAEDGEQPVPVTEETSNQWSLASWVTLSPSVQVLEPNQTALVNVLIEVPEDALPGGRYAMIMHQPANELASEGAASGIAQRVGTLLYFLVDGPINQEAYITNIQIPSLVETGPIPMSFEIDNRSDIHIRPNTVIEIRNMFGQLSGVLEVEPKNVFPYTSREFTSEWERIWGFGKYTALVTTNYGTQGQITRAVATFWMVPIQLLLAGGVIFATTIVVIILIRRHLSHRNDEKIAEIQMLEQKVRELEQDKLEKFSDKKN